MATIRPDVRPARRLEERVRELATTVRWAPAPRWGSSTREHTRYAGYLGGSIVGWTALGLATAAVIGRALGAA
ncbi:chemotaxis protein CheW [Cellulomonas fengjieae]|uniref:Chemotaxis protein CheW n=1 Tax=Cellulomonas fengjieae TaxID=2819978 RepID=A0ABS3SEA8_9CELL|nr:chemotaxis protein CheW [Cellulomonas fengjieae]MBO3084088.1 chemotaxis protein CheW [Cellulomonas fengjieae]QVI64657.1 chemotaxis protein CheW [Cellulomonas fengjieae]